MADYKVTLTSNGADLLAKCIAGKELKFTSIQMGDGEAGGAFDDVTQIVSLKKTLPISAIARTGAKVNVKAVLDFTSITDSFQWKEVALIAEDPDTHAEVVYCYGNAGDKGDWITGGVSATAKSINITALVSSVSSVTAEIDNTKIYATLESLTTKADADLSNVDPTVLKDAVEASGVKTELPGNVVYYDPDDVTPSPVIPRDADTLEHHPADYFAAAADLAAHEADAVSHVTADDRAGWDAKLDAGEAAPPEGLPTSDVRTAAVRAGESIRAGDVVNVSGGTAYRDVVAQANVENVLRTVAHTGTACTKLNSRYSVIATMAAADSSNLFLVRNSDGGVASVGTYQGSGTDGVKHISILRLSDTQFVVQFVYFTTLRTVLCTVSGTNITTGEAKDITSVFNKTEKSVELGGNRWIAIYDFSGLRVVPMRLSGGAPAAGTIYALPSNTGANYISACRLPDAENGDKRVCVCFADTGDGNKCKAVIVTVNSANAVTFGEVVTFASDGINGDKDPIQCCEYRGNVIVTYNASTRGRAMVLTVSGEAISTNSSVELLNGNITYPFVSTDGSIVVMGYSLNAMCADVNDMGITLAEKYRFAQINASHTSIIPISEKRFLLVYADFDNSSYGTTTILEVSGNQIAGSFQDNSCDAIALDAGEGGQSIRVAYNGMVQLAGANAGDWINSDGVMAYCPVDGWLKVLPEWECRYVHGEFVGPAAGEIVEVNVGFCPKAIMITQMSSSIGATMVIKDGTYYIGGSGSSNYQRAVKLLENGFSIGYAQYGATEPFVYMAFK